MSLLQPSFLTAYWKYLAMLNYEVDPTILRPLVPNRTELDDFQGKHFASMVGFLFLNTRVLGLPIPFHRNFEEVNLRFYVRFKQGSEWRRGVVFVKEIVPRFAIAFVARTIYGENYVALPMRHSIQKGSGSAPHQVRYEWRFQSHWNYLSVHPVGDAQPLQDDSEEEFITEHYWGYSAHADGTSSEYQVEHPRWNVWNVRKPELACDVANLYGPQFADHLQGAPSSAFLAEGSSVTVRKNSKLS